MESQDEIIQQNKNSNNNPTIENHQEEIIHQNINILPENSLKEIDKWSASLEKLSVSQQEPELPKPHWRKISKYNSNLKNERDVDNLDILSKISVNTLPNTEEIQYSEIYMTATENQVNEWTRKLVKARSVLWRRRHWPIVHFSPMGFKL